MAVTYTTVPVTSTTSTSSSTKSSVLGKDDFLKLLITEMKNQNPLSPMDGTEYAAQLAQFSSLEQLSNINTALTDSVSSNQLMTQAISNSLATTMIGKTVKASGNSVGITGSGSVTLGYTLANSATTVTTQIYDSAGVLVRTLRTSNAAAGNGSVTWDGENDDGSQMPAGTYTFKVSAVDSEGDAVKASTYVTGKISSVRFTSSGTAFVVDGMEIPLSDILEILNG
jgi:flagellar basal-body rod modification protein FlgD